MAKKNKPNKNGVVYSTNPNFEYIQEEETVESLQPDKQKLYVSLDRKQRGGKQVTLIENFVGSLDDLKQLAKDLKTLCGTGGNVKDGIILIQGDARNKVIGYLEKQGYVVKRKGG